MQRPSSGATERLSLKPPHAHWRRKTTAAFGGRAKREAGIETSMRRELSNGFDTLVHIALLASALRILSSWAEHRCRSPRSHVNMNGRRWMAPRPHVTSYLACANAPMAPLSAFTPFPMGKVPSRNVPLRTPRNPVFRTPTKEPQDGSGSELQSQYPLTRACRPARTLPSRARPGAAPLPRLLHGGRNDVPKSLLAYACTCTCTTRTFSFTP